jgi:recombinational DNA repair protein (RecF pathway)
MENMDDNIEDDSLTTENLLYILIAMKRIKPLNQSLYYTQYMNEIIERLKENEILSKLRNQGTREPIENKV